MTVIHEISVRLERSGDPSPDVLPSKGVEALRKADHAVIMIHGFANSSKEANRKYQRFVRELATVAWPRQITRQAKFFGFQWPGNHGTLGVDQLTYSARVGPASASGRALGELLVELPSTVEVTLVAHSLGCRVALAALERVISLAGADRPNITGVHLFAAAVPVNECVPDKRFGRRYADTEYTVYYSHRDLALMLGFGFGQWMFDHFAQAVGRFGLPEHDRWNRRKDTGLRHKEYWQSSPVAETVARSAGYSAIHQLPATRLTVDSVPNTRSTPRWQLDSRNLPQQVG